MEPGDEFPPPPSPPPPPPPPTPTTTATPSPATTTSTTPPHSAITTTATTPPHPAITTTSTTLPLPAITTTATTPPLPTVTTTATTPHLPTVTTTATTPPLPVITTTTTTAPLPSITNTTTPPLTASATPPATTTTTPPPTTTAPPDSICTTPSASPPPPSTIKSEPPEPKQQSPTPPLPPPPPSTLTIPSHSRWFSFSSIHDTERRALPEFFDGRSPARTPGSYRYLRDAIIRRCWLSPSRRITFTDARRRLVADAGTIRRVFDFLEQWGLINYAPLWQSLPEKPPVEDGEKKEATPVEERKVVAVEEERKAAAADVRKVCSSCAAVCVQTCFVPDKQADVVLCAKCFVRGNYKGGLTSGDFKRVDIAEEEVRNARLDWSEKDTLHLLEAVSHYGDDWKKVAEHVGNGKTQKDCVVRFVKLPFGEQFMGALGGDCWRGNGDDEDDSVGGQHDSKRMRLTPLADASNPIMAQVAFLSAMVGLDVSEAAAQAAVEAVYNVEDVGLHHMNDLESDDIIDGDENNDATISGKAFEEARALLEEERRDLEQSISDIVEIQMKEMQEKILRFEEMELLVERERSQVKYLENVLFADQLSLIQLQARNGSVEENRPLGKDHRPIDS